MERHSRNQLAVVKDESSVDWTVLSISCLLFVSSAALTIYWSQRMSGGMPMPGGWNMSMAWMKMPGQTWLGSAVTFLEMWLVMMVAMMLPSLMPALVNYRRHAAQFEDAGSNKNTILAGIGYFVTWAGIGAFIYPLGVALATAEMRSQMLARLVPAATGIALLIVGSVQLTSRKVRLLNRCRDEFVCEPLNQLCVHGWQYGLHLGWQCIKCCSGLMLVLLVAGVMDIRLMTIVTVAITLERLSPWTKVVPRAIGIVSIAVGMLAIFRI